MLTNAFIGNAQQPTDDELTAKLGPAKALWVKLLADLAKLHIDGEEWNSYSRRAGWALKVKHETRTILYLSPAQGCFMASFALGEKALQAARKTRLPKAVIEIMDVAKRYAEGTGVRIEVYAAKDLAVVKKLAIAKLEN